MGSSKKQTVGYRYFAKLMMVIGNPIEKLLGVNFDNRGWIMHDPRKHSPVSLIVDAPNLYGENEGGVAGNIKIYKGEKAQEPDPDYISHMNSLNLPASAYPYLSYLVFKGQGAIDGLAGKFFPHQHDSFYFGNSGFMKEMLLWPKRIHVRNDGRSQWYDEKAEIREIGENACQFIEGKFKDFFSLISEIGTRSPRYILSNIFSSVRWAGSEKKGVMSLEINFDFASSEEAAFNFHLKLNSASGYASVETSEFITLDTRSDHYTQGFWDHSTDFIFKIKPCSLTRHFILFDFVFSAKTDTSGLDGYSDLYYEMTPPIPTTGYLCKDGIDTGDLNPIHKIREILTDDTAMNKPESDINDENFKKAADRTFAEGLGISWAITEKSCKDALDEVCSHIEAGVRVNRQTGKYEVILFRDDWLDLSNALEFSESNIKSFNIEVINSDDAINTLNVNYYDRTNIKNSAFNVYENGLIQTMGFESAETVDFPYFMNQRNAEIVANWKLKQLSTPAWRGSFTTGVYEARKLNRYDAIKLTWRSKGIVDLPVRVMKINLGDGRDNSVTIDFVEIIPYSNMLQSLINPDLPVNQIVDPQPNTNTVFEMPYFEAVQVFGQTQVDAELEANPEMGYLMSAVAKPQNNSLYALLYTDSGTGVYTDFERVSRIDYAPFAYLDQNIKQLDSTFKVSNITDIVQARAGSLIILNDELMVYESYDVESKVLTVRRGALDTVPHTHAVGNGVLYFYDDYSAYDPTQYTSGENVKAQVLTTTPSGILSLNPQAVKNLEITGRANRPYPPANVKINGAYYPEKITSELVLTWVDRNRVQQTGGTILGWFDEGVSVEPGVTYHLTVYEIDKQANESMLFDQNIGSVNSYSVDLSLTRPETEFYKIALYAVRDGYESFQRFEHQVSTSFTAPYDLSGEFIFDGFSRPYQLTAEYIA